MSTLWKRMDRVANDLMLRTIWAMHIRLRTCSQWIAARPGWGRDWREGFDIGEGEERLQYEKAWRGRTELHLLHLCNWNTGEHCRCETEYTSILFGMATITAFFLSFGFTVHTFESVEGNAQRI